MSKRDKLKLTPEEVESAFAGSPWAEKFPPSSTWIRLRSCCKFPNRRSIRGARREGFPAVHSGWANTYASIAIVWFATCLTTELRHMLDTKRDTSEKIGEHVSIFKRDDNWYAQWQSRKEQIRRSLKTKNKKRALSEAHKIEQSFLNNGTERPVAEKSPIFIRDAIEKFLSHHETDGRAEGTLKKYRQVLSMIADFAESQHIDDLDDLDLDFIDQYRKQRKREGRADKTITTEVGILKTLVLFAKSRRLISSDPLEGLRLSKPKQKPQPHWSKTEVEMILKEESDIRKSVYTLYAETGMRIGELKWLTWDDIDFENNLIHIRPKDGWRTKTGNVRAVPMSQNARNILEGLLRTFRWVFTAQPSQKYSEGGTPDLGTPTTRIA